MISKFMEGFTVKFGETMGLACGLVGGLYLIGKVGEYISNKEEVKTEETTPDEEEVTE